MPIRRAFGLVAALVVLVALGRPAAQEPTLAFVTQDVLDRLIDAPGRPVRLLVEGDVAQLQVIAQRLGLAVDRTLNGYVVMSADAAQVALLQAEPAVKLIAGDLRVSPLMTVADQSMGADQARAGERGFLGLGYTGVTGRGIGVAVVDSGIAPHVALGDKVVAAVSFVPGDTATTDRFGHGTHIAGIIAGNRTAVRVTPEYSGGVAPGAHLVNVRVLGSDGSGLTSSVIAGLDWVIANRQRYGIRVVNLSLGHPATGPCLRDPLCTTVGRVVSTGIVVVVSAGNHGKAPDGQLVLGTITSPGTSPLALTVGATNTWGTVDRRDDTITTYSSRGPAAFDLLVKPDVAAPGNKIVSLEAKGSYLARNYAGLHVAGSGSNAYRRMSGTSMAAGMVSGGVALLLQASPALTPFTAKLALQLTATPVREGVMAGGAGSVDLWAARKLVGNQLTNTLTTALPTSTIEGVTTRAGGLAYHDGGRLMRRIHAGAGLDLISVRDMLLAWLTGTGPMSDTLYVLQSSPLAGSSASQILWGDGVVSAAGQQILWGDQVFDTNGQQILWGDQILWGEQVLWGDQILWGDQTTHGEQILWGDSWPRDDSH